MSALVAEAASVQMQPHADKWHGMVYWRTAEGILTEGGGGSCVLHTPLLCNDEEWAAICAGNPPTKFAKPWARS